MVQAAQKCDPRKMKGSRIMVCHAGSEGTGFVLKNNFIV
jgi:hypothetical protein